METFKALASESRLQVLRALDSRRKTLSELARELALNKATIHEHLQLLVATGLVQKEDEGRKWIYYKLTWRGERLLHPQETTTFAIMLGLGVAAAGGGVMMLGKALQWWWAEQQMVIASDPTPEGDAGPAADPEEAGSPAAQESDPQGASAPPGEPDESQLRDDAGDMADGGDEAAETDGGFDPLDEDGVLAIVFFALSLALFLAATLMRRFRSRES